MPVNIVDAADPAQFESVGFDRAAESAEPDISKVTGSETFPQIASAGAQHDNRD
jgi:hypothetical protein